MSRVNDTAGSRASLGDADLASIPAKQHPLTRNEQESRFRTAMRTIDDKDE
jgi:hypothetical protein